MTKVERSSPRNSDEPIAEIAEILAAGLMRVLARKSSQTSTEDGESSLDILPGESGHAAQGNAESLHE